MKNVKLSSRLLSFVLILGIFAILTLLCGFTVSFKAAFEIWVFLLTATIPLASGSFLIYKYSWKNLKIALLLTALLIGFTFFAVSLVSMVMDGRASSWQQIFSFSTISGVIAFVAVFVISPIYASFFRRKNNSE